MYFQQTSDCRLVVIFHLCPFWPFICGSLAQLSIPLHQFGFLLRIFWVDLTAQSVDDFVMKMPGIPPECVNSISFTISFDALSKFIRKLLFFFALVLFCVFCCCCCFVCVAFTVRSSLNCVLLNDL